VRLKSEFQLPADNFFDPIDVFKQVTKLHAYQLQLARLKVLYSGRPAALQGNKFGFQRVLTNLLLNSIEAHRRNHPGKRGNIYVIAREKDDAIQLSIEDEAGGIVKQNRIEDRCLADSVSEEGELQHSDTLMDSGFTTKAYGNHGDGLKVVKEIISQEFGGNVSFVSAEKGVKVILNLPK
jgi:signal transduction histidine kinase